MPGRANSQGQSHGCSHAAGRWGMHVGYIVRARRYILGADGAWVCGTHEADWRLADARASCRVCAWRAAVCAWGSLGLEPAPWLEGYVLDGAGIGMSTPVRAPSAWVMVYETEPAVDRRRDALLDIVRGG